MDKGDAKVESQKLLSQYAALSNPYREVVEEEV